jgi:hypothetical protein
MRLFEIRFLKYHPKYQFYGTNTADNTPEKTGANLIDRQTPAIFTDVRRQSMRDGGGR